MKPLHYIHCFKKTWCPFLIVNEMRASSIDWSLKDDFKNRASDDQPVSQKSWLPRMLERRLPNIFWPLVAKIQRRVIDRSQDSNAMVLKWSHSYLQKKWVDNGYTGDHECMAYSLRQIRWHVERRSKNIQWHLNRWVALDLPS